jgi:hypothetical protein
VLDRTSVSWEDQQSRLASLGGRTLSDQLLRQIEIEIAGAKRHVKNREGV